MLSTCVLFTCLGKYVNMKFRRKCLSSYKWIRNEQLHMCAYGLAQALSEGHLIMFDRS